MEETYNVEKVETKGGSSWQLPVIALLAIGLLASLGYTWSVAGKVDSATRTIGEQVRTVQATAQKDTSALKDELAKTEAANTSLQSDLGVVTNKLKITQGQLRKARQEAATNHTETEQKLTALDTSVHSELATKATSEDVKTVDTRVTQVNASLDKTISDLNLAKSELGTLIARNHDEIDLLRRKGERDYYEFSIAGKNQPQKVGNVSVELKGVNEKKNRANLVLVVDDKRIEEKNQPINQPIFFYLSGSRTPQELVINKVGKNMVSGYLSVPKAGATVTAAKSGN